MQPPHERRGLSAIILQNRVTLLALTGMERVSNTLYNAMLTWRAVSCIRKEMTVTEVCGILIKWIIFRSGKSVTHPAPNMERHVDFYDSEGSYFRT